MSCVSCGHTHDGDFCRNSFCSVCGLGGNLESMCCDVDRMERLEDAVEKYLREKEGLK